MCVYVERERRERRGARVEDGVVVVCVRVCGRRRGEGGERREGPDDNIFHHVTITFSVLSSTHLASCVC